MEFKFYIGTKIYYGPGCVEKNGDEIGRLGKRTVIVTGRGSAKKSGALDDMTAVLSRLNIQYMIYDRIGNNPTTEEVGEAGMAARRFNADFIIGIGGGSPLDAAKAVAVLAANDISPLDLFKNKFTKKPLPIVAIPTTAGTGSEVTPYSILTRGDLDTKKSFGNDDTFPVIAFEDPAYIESMPYEVTVNTAVDALSHAVEGYISKRSTPISDLLAQESIAYFGKCVPALLSREIGPDTRDKLLYMSMLAGMVISHTGTTFVHALGYNLTYFKDIPHGRANAFFMGEYLDFNYDMAKEKIDRVYELLNLKNRGEFDGLMKALIPDEIILSDKEIERYASISMEQKSVARNIRNVSREDLTGMMKKLFRKY